MKIEHNFFGVLVHSFAEQRYHIVVMYSIFDQIITSDYETYEQPGKEDQRTFRLYCDNYCYHALTIRRVIQSRYVCDILIRIVKCVGNVEL